MSGPATPAPVANDILDRAGDLAIQIVNDMREAAPQVTEAAVRYVWAQGVTGLVLSICMLVLALTLVLAAAMPLFWPPRTSQVRLSTALAGPFSRSSRSF